MNDFYFLIPFQFVHNHRQGMNSGSVKVSRELRRTILNLSEEQILRNTQAMPNHDFLLTLLLADGETKYKMFQSLSESAKETVKTDLNNIIGKIEALWK